MVRPATPLGPIGLILPTFAQDTVPAWAEPSGGPGGGAVSEITSVCRRAEELGAGALWTCDHLFWHGPCLECMVVLSIAATATDRALLGTCVIQLPLRQAPVVAKQAASLQALTGGRVVLGVGVGSHVGEYEQAGAAFHTRGSELDAGIKELRRSWHSGAGTTAGDPEAGGPARYRQLPAPAPVPVWVGGSSEAALRRAATLADGWMPLFLSAAEYRAALERLAKEVDRVGREAGEVTPSIVLFVSIDDDAGVGRRRGTGWMSSLYGIPAKAFDHHLVAGTAAEVADVVTTYRDAGAEHAAVYITADEPLEQFERLTTALSAAGVPTRG